MGLWGTGLVPSGPQRAAHQGASCPGKAGQSPPCSSVWLSPGSGPSPPSPWMSLETRLPAPRTLALPALFCHHPPSLLDLSQQHFGKLKPLHLRR